MKNGHTLLFLALTSAAIAQSPYRPFPEGNAGWVENHGWLYSDGFGDFYTSCDRTIDFAADTIVNGTNYHRLRSRGVGTSTQVYPPLDSWPYEEASHTFCLFRQDVAARQVFVFDTLNQQEVLWYDLTLGLGQYPITWESNSTAVYVVALDSMELNDGWHRTWVLGMPYNGQMLDSAYCTIIEGVGSTFGLNTVYGLIPPFEHGDMLNCHSREEVPIYPLGTAECDLSMGDVSVRPEPAPVRVYPNPASEKVVVAGADTTGWRYALMDLMGNCVQHGPLVGSIDIRPLAPAVYALQTIDAHGGRYAMLVLKE